jgi:tetratricopeptide (TPR) repeat protein
MTAVQGFGALSGCAASSGCEADSAEDWYRRGRLWALQGRYAEALALFDAALHLEPRWAQAWVFHGVVLTRLGCYEEALESFQRAIASNSAADLPTNSEHGGVASSRDAAAVWDGDQPCCREAWIYQGAVLDYLGRSMESATCYVAALKLPPSQEQYPMWLPTTPEPEKV